MPDYYSKALITHPKNVFMTQKVDLTKLFGVNILTRFSKLDHFINVIGLKNIVSVELKYLAYKKCE